MNRNEVNAECTYVASDNNHYVVSISLSLGSVLIFYYLQLRYKFLKFYNKRKLKQWSHKTYYKRRLLFCSIIIVLHLHCNKLIKLLLNMLLKPKSINTQILSHDLGVTYAQLKLSVWTCRNVFLRVYIYIIDKHWIICPLSKKFIKHTSNCSSNPWRKKYNFCYWLTSILPIIESSINFCIVNTVLWYYKTQN